jgi:hypothetical protein
MLRLISRSSGTAVERSSEKWSPRKTLAFIGITCGAFWAAVIYLIWG